MRKPLVVSSSYNQDTAVAHVRYGATSLNTFCVCHERHHADDKHFCNPYSARSDVPIATTKSSTHLTVVYISPYTVAICDQLHAASPVLGDTRFDRSFAFDFARLDVPNGSVDDNVWRIGHENQRLGRSLQQSRLLVVFSCAAFLALNRLSQC